MASTTDYRTLQFSNSNDAGVFSWTGDPSFVDTWFKKINGGASSAAIADLAYGRSIQMKQVSVCGKVARFSYSDLCRQHLAADDYNELCRQFHTILVDDIPCLTVDQHNEARRLTLFIDCCYEHHIRLVCSMEGPPEDVLGSLVELKNIGMNDLSQGMAGCGDSDSSSSSSGVLSAVSRIKQGIEDCRQRKLATYGDDATIAAEVTPVARDESKPFDINGTSGVLASEIARAQAHDGGQDNAPWRQNGDDVLETTQNLRAPLQVSKGWDDRRRISQFTWESSDPTSEQASIKGVFAAAVASLMESGFVVDRAISRLREMQTDAFQHSHHKKHGLL